MMQETARRTLRLVVVDDSDDLRQMLVLRWRRSADFDVVGQAPDGLQALDVVERHHPDIVLMDLDMPEMDGLEAAAILRQRHPGLILVALTSHDRQESLDAATAAGFDRYVVKGQPLHELDELLAALH